MVACIVVLIVGPLRAQEATWSSWAGPNGDFTFSPSEEKELKQPKILWERPLGNGHSSVVTDGDYCFCLYSTGEIESIQKIELETGKLLWQVDRRVSIEAKRYPGPHATPLVSKSTLVSASIDGVIYALSATTGEVLWERDLKRDFGTTLPQSGYASSPLLFENSVIVPTLGKAQRRETESFQLPDKDSPPGAVALELNSGRTVWGSESFRSSHASPVLFEVNQQPIICIHGMFELIALEPRSGNLLWKHRLRDLASDNVSFTPLWDQTRQQILVSHGYCERGTQAIGVTQAKGRWETKLNWSNRGLRLVHTNAVLVADLLVGTTKEPTLLFGVDCTDGQTVFRKRGFTKANLICSSKLALLLEENGVLRSGIIDMKGFTQRWQMQPVTGKAWTAPSWFDGKILVRSDESLCCLIFD